MKSKSVLATTLLIAATSSMAGGTLFDIPGKIGDGFRQARDVRTSPSSGGGIIDGIVDGIQDFFKEEKVIPKNLQDCLSLASEKREEQEPGTFFESAHFTNVEDLRERDLSLSSPNGPSTKWGHLALIGLSRMTRVNTNAPGEGHGVNEFNKCREAISIEKVEQVKVSNIKPIIKETDCRKVSILLDKEPLSLYYCLGEGNVLVDYLDQPVTIIKDVEIETY